MRIEKPPNIRASIKGTHKGDKPDSRTIQLGPRPFYLVSDMEESPLKEELLDCQDGPFEKSNFSIGHRGAAIQFPEHTRESYVASVRMGAGIMACDVTFTRDRELVCRHFQCDLHTTTNILAPPMWALVTLENGQIVPFEYALTAKANGLKLITWTLERSGLPESGGGWYYQGISDATDNDGDMLVLLDVLAQDVGIEGIFSDWPATLTY